jgi:hypothetical protein
MNCKEPEADLTLKSHFVSLQVFCWGKPRRNHLSPMVKYGFQACIDRNFVRIKNDWLESWDSYRKVDWINEIEYPELTYQETQKFLSTKFLSN